MKKQITLLIMTYIFMITGCSSEKEVATITEEKPDETEQVQEDKKESEVQEEVGNWWEEEFESYQLNNLPRELDELEKDMVKKEGTFSGDKYDFEKIKPLLDELPEDSSENVLESAILHLIREDYHEEVEIFVNFDPTVDVQVERPDEELDRPTEEQATSSSHFAILLDASGSMNADNNGKTRMELAKEAITDFVDSLPKNSTVSLRVYGHKGSGSEAERKMSCESTEVLFNDYVNRDDFTKSLQEVTPAGWTPIAKALQESEKDFPKEAQAAIVYVVSDGIETCDGDPVAAAKVLSEKGIEPIINIIGFQVDDEAKKLLEKVAEAGQGTFTYAGNQQDLEKYWHDEYERMQKAWDEWQAEGMKKADEISDQLMDLADETGNSIMDKSDLEFKRAEEIINYLNNERGMDTGNLWSMFYNRSVDIWRYGYNNQTENWRESYHNGIDAWRYYYNTGVDKWTEYYHKMYR